MLTWCRYDNFNGIQKSPQSRRGVMDAVEQVGKDIRDEQISESKA